MVGSPGTGPPVVGPSAGTVEAGCPGSLAGLVVLVGLVLADAEESPATVVVPESDLQATVTTAPSRRTMRWALVRFSGHSTAHPRVAVPGGCILPSVPRPG
ncbi:MAG: hypothetical protein ACT4PW_01950 [Acidimicrobiia bacterium]